MCFLKFPACFEAIFFVNTGWGANCSLYFIKMVNIENMLHMTGQASYVFIDKALFFSHNIVLWKFKTRVVLQ